MTPCVSEKSLSIGSYMVGEQRRPRLFLCVDFEPCEPRADLALYAAGELRRVALEMLAAADRCEGGAP